MCPFLDSPTIRPLYDVHDGGPPLGFRCQLHFTVDPWVKDFQVRDCAKVTRTLRGMVQHQRMIHGIRQQQEFDFETIAKSKQD